MHSPSTFSHASMQQPSFQLLDFSALLDCLETASRIELEMQQEKKHSIQSVGMNFDAYLRPLCLYSENYLISPVFASLLLLM